MSTQFNKTGYTLEKGVFSIGEIKTLENEFDQIVRWPKKPSDKEMVIAYLATKFDYENKYTEKEVNDFLGAISHSEFVEIKDAAHMVAGDRNDIFASVNKGIIEDGKENSTIHSLGDTIKTPKRSVIPRSKKQKAYVRALKTSQIVMSLGPAGTGKTYLAVAVALTMLLEKKIDRIILSRPAVEAGERLGFLPGDMKDKVDPYLRPLYDSLYDLLDYEKIQKKIEIGDIEIAPVAFMRGRTLKNSFAILDEAQNATDIQIKMFLTRIGENSKIVINGDSSQIDLINKKHSGLLRSKNLLKNLNEISIVDFDHTDVVRHPLVTKIVKAYDDFKDN